MSKTRIFVGAGHVAGSGGTGSVGGLYRCDAGDGVWHASGQGLPDRVEARAFCTHPTERGVIYAATQDGPYRSLDAGAHWHRLDFPDRDVVTWSLAFHPGRPNVMYAGVAPVGIYRSEDSGDHWRRLPGAVNPGHCVMNFPTRVMRFAFDASHPDDVYAALEVSGVILSRDAGEHWTDLSTPLIRLADQPHLKSRIGSDNDAEGMLDAHAIAASCAAPGTAFVAVRMGLFVTRDQGASWRDLEIGRFSPLTYCRDVIVSAHDPKVMYACLSPASRSTDGSLYRSDDVGQTWQRFDHGIKAEATMMAVAEHPADPSTVYCVSRCGQVFGTEDAGRTWSESRLPSGVQDVYAVACV